MKKIRLFATAFLTATVLMFTACQGTSKLPIADTEDPTIFPDDDKNDPLAELSSVEMASKLTIGWNLGNTLDANSETGWGMPMTTKAMIDAVAAAGFKTIRIPVSWHYHVNSDYQIDTTWMARVKTIVDWALENDMYVILNVHHDNISISKFNSTPGFCITDNQTYQTNSKNYLKKVWIQIAKEFADYDNKLIFEVLNEPRDIDGEWKGNEWSTNSSEVMDIITNYEQTCIKAIRSIKGNKNRFLMIPGYAASGSDPNMLKLFKMPSDVDGVNDKLLLSTHAYSPYDFAMNNMTDTVFGSDDESSLDSIFTYLKNTYTDKGIGVVMGEASASDKNNLAERIKWTNYYFAKAKAAGIPVVLWDNMVLYPSSNPAENHGYFDRTTLTWYYPTMIKAMMDTVGVTNYQLPEFVTQTPDTIGWNESNSETLISTTITLGWNNKNSIPAQASVKQGSILKITTTANTSFRMINNDWTYNYNNGTIVNGKGGENITATEKEVYYVLTSDDATKLKSGELFFADPDGSKISKVQIQY